MTHVMARRFTGVSTHLARPAGGARVNIQTLLDALDVQDDAARTLADGLRLQITALQDRLQEAETHLDHLATTRKTVTAQPEENDRSAGRNS